MSNWIFVSILVYHTNCEWNHCYQTKVQIKPYFHEHRHLQLPYKNQKNILLLIPGQHLLLNKVEHILYFRFPVNEKKKKSSKYRLAMTFIAHSCKITWDQPKLDHTRWASSDKHTNSGAIVKGLTSAKTLHPSVPNLDVPVLYQHTSQSQPTIVSGKTIQGHPYVKFRTLNRSLRPATRAWSYLVSSNTLHLKNKQNVC